MMDEFLEKHMKRVGSDIKPQARVIINNVLMFLIELKEDPDKLRTINFNRPGDLTAKICGVSSRTVSQIKWECAHGGPKNPRGNIRQSCPVTNVDENGKNEIRKIVSSFYLNGEYPTINKILKKAKQSIEGLKCGRTSMRKILFDLGYTYKIGPDGKKHISEGIFIASERPKLSREKDLDKIDEKNPLSNLDEAPKNETLVNESCKKDETGYKTQKVDMLEFEAPGNEMTENVSLKEELLEHRTMHNITLKEELLERGTTENITLKDEIVEYKASGCETTVNENNSKKRSWTQIEENSVLKNKIKLEKFDSP